ncbi:hypothetical protein ACFV2H_51040, partial [Streptomyces sp. NPDC059629]|uniref:hypothetical protein n=1 Tax=Streptomyces sp. NPDC059629 TaxID=3346889 RepID=UPI00368A9373
PTSQDSDASRFLGTEQRIVLDLHRAGAVRQPPARPAAAPKPSKPGPGQPPGSKNKHRAKRHDVGKTIKRAESI